MVLVFDIGNTNIVCGIKKENEWLYIWRWPTLFEDPEIYYTYQLSNELLEGEIISEDIHQIVVSSVVPRLNTHFANLIYNLFDKEALYLNPSLYKRLKIKINNPYEIGSDLVANVIGADELSPAAKIIVDFGTALTFTTVSDQKEIMGVSIAPGIKTAISSLFQQTAQLPPEVPLILPDSVLGKNTVHAIQSGILHGYVGMVRYQIQKIREELNQDLICIATGGLSSILVPLEKEFDIVDKTLTLNGLAIAGKRYYES